MWSLERPACPDPGPGFPQPDTRHRAAADRRAVIAQQQRDLLVIGSVAHHLRFRPARRGITQPGGDALSILFQDARYALRLLRRSPVFALVGILTIGLGVGANTAIFSVCSALLLRPLPYAQPERLVMLWESNLAQNAPMNPVAPANYVDWKERSHLFEDIGLSVDATYALTGDSAEPESVRGYRFSENFFRVMGVAPALGRTF